MIIISITTEVHTLHVVHAVHVEHITHSAHAVHSLPTGGFLSPTLIS